METKVKNRGWVKNAAIIFLSVMLLLTFFSNTIMNRSLPEVATQNVSSGTITAKIRGTGTVAANQTYDVVVNQTRTVKTVMIKVGQEVNVGDVLFVLADTEGEELKAAQAELRSLNKQYQTALINAADTDYAKENRNIRQAKERLQKAEQERDELYVSDAEIAAAAEAVAAAKEAVAAAVKKVEKAKKELDSIGELVKPDDATINEMKKQLTAKEEALDAAQQVLTTAEIIYGRMYDAIESAARRKLTWLAIDSNEDNFNNKTASQQERYIDGKMEYYMPYASADIEDGTLWPYNDAELGEHQFPEECDCTPEEQEAHFNKTLAADYKVAYDEITKCRDNISTLENDISELEEKIRIARRSDNSEIYEEYDEAYKQAVEKQTAAEEKQKAAEDKLEDLKSRQTKYKEAENNVQDCQNTLEDLVFSLQEQKKSDNKNAQLQNLDMQDLLTQISEVQEKIKEYSADATAKEIVADVSGTIQSVNVTAGNSTTAGSPMATIEVPDMGYSMSFSVTNEQARRVHVGDTASVSNYYWGSEITAELTNIKTDPQNPQSSKLLVFDVRGDVSVGTKLTISVGQRSAEYDYIVPNSAIRSDSNGDFVLVVVAKNSPLGNKYIATRVDITKIANDDTSTAITGGIENGDFVITTSTKPISNGDRVRMADTLSETKS